MLTVSELESRNVVSLGRSLLLGGIGVFASAGVATPSPQVEAWQQSPVNGRWYTRTTARVSWIGAQIEAERWGGHLTSIRSATENNWLAANLLGSIPNGYFWIGLYQDTSSPSYSEPAGGWKWVGGDPFVYANWSANAPNDLLGTRNFARTAGGGGSGTRWVDDTLSGATSASSAQDWYIPTGTNVIFQTTLTTINFGTLSVVYDPSFPNNPASPPQPSFQPSTNLQVSGGVVDVRHFYVAEGATLKIEGPNPFLLLASGDVWIRGDIIASGTSNLGVNTLNTTNIPEPGAPGQAGGGRGGTGSYFTTQSTPQGGHGYGAFDVADKGGQGGEMGWSPNSSVESRRGAGGGGGRFGADVAHSGSGAGTSEQRRIGFDAEPGFDNLQGANGAFSGPLGPLGGAAGPSPFTDSVPSNNFYGALRATDGSLTIGELVRPWAGSGGGAGGDAHTGAYPGSWSPAGDEKGAGGAGGGGSINVLAMGSVMFGPEGRVLARGGVGGGGENTSFLNRVGGGSGGGSGGHVILQSAVRVDFRAKPPVNLYDTATSAPDADANNWAINALGGQGGAGNGDLGGGIQSPTGQRETLPTNDACPPGYPTTGVNGCRGHVHGAGGDGGPGLIQIHTPNGVVGLSNQPSADILLPSAAGATLDNLCAPRPIFAYNGPTSPAPYLVNLNGGGFGALELDSTDCDQNGIPDTYQIANAPALDANSDGVIDACQVPCYLDSDGDGFGAPPVSYIGFCVPGFSIHDTDCNDFDPQLNPYALDLCNGVDDDCDNVIDNDATFSQYFRDGDQDGFGDPADTLLACAHPPGYVLIAGDCDDTNGSVFPGALEICDGLDNDCDGAIDPGNVTTYCTAGTSVHGCVPSISGLGAPSSQAPSGFDIVVGSVPGQRYGTIFYGFYQAAIPWATFSPSYQCVAFPIQRAGNLPTGGIAGQCNGELRLDFNAWRAANPGALGNPFVAGQVFHAQGWFRDPGAPKQTNLSDGLRFTLCD